MSALLTQFHPAATEIFQDAYVVDFLQLAMDVTRKRGR